MSYFRRDAFGAPAPTRGRDTMKPASMGARLVIDAIDKSYGTTRALDEVSLIAEPGEMLALLGPSGCGKTTLLKIIAGLIDLDAGEVYVNGQGMSGLPPHKRDMGMLFQNYALFPHLDVFANVAFGLEMRRLPKTQIEQRARRALDRVQLTAFAERMPRELSGGQQQRVALARAIAYEPTVLLLDEPLAALDKNLREGMQMELRALCHQLELTTVLVTHDQEEAMTMADKIAVMREGRLEQVGTPRAIYQEPQNRFVAGFIGTSNFFAFSPRGNSGGTVNGDGEHGLALEAEASDTTVLDEPLAIAIRPEHISLSVTDPGQAMNALSGSVTQIVFRGAHVTVVVATEHGRDLICSAPANALPDSLCEGQSVWAHWRREHALLIEDR